MSTLYDGQGNAINIDSGGGDMTVSVQNLLSFKDWPQYNGNIVGTAGNWQNVGSPDRTCTVIEVAGGEIIEIAGYENGNVCITKTFSAPVQGAAAPALATGMSYNAQYGSINGITLPSDARYIIIQTKGSNGGVPTTLKLNGNDYLASVREDLTDLHYNNGVKWKQFGDSITCGHFSYWLDKENDVATYTDRGGALVWPRLAAKLNNWKYEGGGRGGQGWVYGNYPAYTHVREIQDYSVYNLVTFAWGINDWKGNPEWGSISDSYTYSDDLTPTTVVESMRYCFDYILRRNPEIKIIVVSPFNCRGYGSHNNHPYGTYETSYARGHKKGGVDGTTLDDFADLMQSVCDEYGIEMIDETRFSVLNRENIPELLPDGVHPSVRCHRLLARELSKKLNFNMGSVTGWNSDYTGGFTLSTQSISLQRGESTTFSFTLDTKPQNTLLVLIDSSDTSKVTVNPGYKEINPNKYNTEQTVTVNAKSDAALDNVPATIYVAVPESPTDLVETVTVTVTDAG